MQGNGGGGGLEVEMVDMAGMTEEVEMVAGLVAAQVVVPVVAKAGATAVGMVALLEAARGQRRVEVSSEGVEGGWLGGKMRWRWRWGVVAEEVVMEAAGWQ